MSTRLQATQPRGKKDRGLSGGSTQGDRDHGPDVPVDTEQPGQRKGLEALQETSVLKLDTRHQLCRRLAGFLLCFPLGWTGCRGERSCWWHSDP